MNRREMMAGTAAGVIGAALPCVPEATLLASVPVPHVGLWLGSVIYSAGERVPGTIEPMFNADCGCDKCRSREAREVIE